MTLAHPESPTSPAQTWFCGVSTSSHLNAVLGTLQSIRRFHPGARFLMMVVDEASSVPAVDGIERIDAGTVIDPRALSGMRSRYTPAELCFAAKPFLLRAAFEAGASQAHYLDGDCLAFASLDPLCRQLDEADLQLTPHSLSPIPDDGRTPSALTVLRAGSFNAGYIGVRNTAQGRAALDWLAAMTEKHAFNRPREGMCGDQRWLDLAPALFPGLTICRHPGANVGYWNLHERPLSRDAEGRPQAAGEPLMFFHFSGYDPARPESLSVHQNRHAVVPGSVLADLLAEYRLRAPDLVRTRKGLASRLLGFR